MAVTIRYEPNHREFGLFMMSGQTQLLANDAARNGVVYARAYAQGDGLPATYIASIKAEEGPIAVLGGNPRRTSRLVAEHELAGVFEFGSGRQSTGRYAKMSRPQGGYSDPYRILGRAGARVGSPPRKSR